MTLWHFTSLNVELVWWVNVSEKNSSTVGPSASVEPMPVRCQCTALNHKLWRVADKSISIMHVYFREIILVNEWVLRINQETKTHQPIRIIIQ
jgi:hypothetical protein